LFDVNRAGTDNDRGSISNRRTTLQSKIEIFHSSIQNLLGNLDWDGIDLQDSIFVDTMKRRDEEDGVFQPEISKLWMPSFFGKDHCIKNGWGALVEEELQLRIGQANELLSKIRLGLGGKGTLYRTSVRKATSYDTSTRARQKVAQVSDTITKHVKSYRLAQNALVKLGASESTLRTFKPLLDSDLKCSADFLEENRYGQRNDKLAWFWRQGPDKADNNHGWMEERMCFSQVIIYKNLQLENR
jgi:hypothetical protein